MDNYGDMSGLVSDAAELACDRLDIKLEHDSFAGPGGRSYSDDDVAGINEQMEQFAHLNFLLAGAPGYRAYVLSPEQIAVIAAVVAPSKEGIETDAIFTDAWLELQAMFPPSLFWEWAKEHEDDGDNHAYYAPGTVE